MVNLPIPVGRSCGRHATYLNRADRADDGGLIASMKKNSLLPSRWTLVMAHCSSIARDRLGTLAFPE